MFARLRLCAALQLARATTAPLLGMACLSGPIGAYAVSTAFAVLALCFALGAIETLPKQKRVAFSMRGSNPLGFLRLLRSGKTIAALAAILALQTLHDGEGDVWQVRCRWPYGRSRDSRTRVARVTPALA